MASMYEMVVSCITKPSKDRSTEEIRVILPWLSKKSDIFAKLKPEVLQEIIKNCSFEERKRDDIIIRQGDKGDCFYVMLSGRVSIFINTEAVPDNPEEASVVVTEDKFKGECNAKKELDRNRYGNFITVFESGKAFGELALINADCIRNASIIADELTHLLVVNRDLYNRSMKEIQTQEFNQRLSFVNNSQLFSNWLSKYKRQVAFSLRKEKFEYNLSLVNQGELTNGLTFILKGQAMVVINANQHTVQYPWLNIVNNNDDIRLVDVNDLDRNLDFESKKPLQNSMTKRLQYNEAEQRQAMRNIEVCIVTKGEVIGDIEQGLELNTYASSVITIEPTEVFILDAKNFERLCNPKRNFKTLKLLKKQAHYKINHRGQRTESKPIPFYTRLNELLTAEEEKEAKESELKTQKLESLKHVEKPEALFAHHRGPLIDLYGPGSVFYRNRQLRKEKQLIEQKRQITEMALKGHRGIQHGEQIMAAMFGTDKGEDSDDDVQIAEDLNAHASHDTNENAAHSKMKNNRDWETGSVHLHSLESRLQNWFLSVDSLTSDKKSNSTKPPEHYTVLKRFKQEEEKKIVPGKKIFLRPRQQPQGKPKPLQDSSNEVTNSTSKIKTNDMNGKKNSEDQVVDQMNETIHQDTSLTENNSNIQRKSKTEVHRNVLSRQYTMDEYKQLKQLLKKKEMEMRVFQMAMSI